MTSSDARHSSGSSEAFLLDDEAWANEPTWHQSQNEACEVVLGKAHIRVISNLHYYYPVTLFLSDILFFFLGFFIELNYWLIVDHRTRIIISSYCIGNWQLLLGWFVITFTLWRLDLVVGHSYGVNDHSLLICARLNLDPPIRIISFVFLFFCFFWSILYGWVMTLELYEN